MTAAGPAAHPTSAGRVAPRAPESSAEGYMGDAVGAANMIGTDPLSATITGDTPAAAPAPDPRPAAGPGRCPGARHVPAPNPCPHPPKTSTLHPTPARCTTLTCTRHPGQGRAQGPSRAPALTRDPGLGRGASPADTKLPTPEALAGLVFTGWVGKGGGWGWCVVLCHEHSLLVSGFDLGGNSQASSGTHPAACSFLICFT